MTRDRPHVQQPMKKELSHWEEQQAPYQQLLLPLACPGGEFVQDVKEGLRERQDLGPQIHPEGRKPCSAAFMQNDSQTPKEGPHPAVMNREKGWASPRERARRTGGSGVLPELTKLK